MFLRQHYYFTFGGFLGGGLEDWSVGLRFRLGLGPLEPETEGPKLEELRAILVPAWQQATNPSGAVLTWAKLNLIGLDGKYVRQTTNVVDFPAVSSPSAGTMPLQCALVITLETALSRGLANKGRIYLPDPRGALSGPGRTLDAAATATAADWAANLMTALNTVGGLGDVSVASSVRTGAEESVTRISVGSVIDTMRSRRGKLLEVRSSDTVTTGGSGGSF